MTIDEAIKHCEEKAEELEKRVKPYQCESINKKLYEVNKKEWDSCVKRAKEHRQLAEWLRELKAYREARDEIIRKRDSSQWSELVVHGFSHAIHTIDNHLKEVNANDGDSN